MPDWSCTPGSTLLIPSGPEGNHLFIILTSPKDFDGYRDSSVLVNVSTIKKGPFDDTCVLQPGEHSFIVSNSYVAYRQARVERRTDLIDKVESRFFIPHDPVSDELLKRIQKGLHQSKQTRKFLKGIIF